VDAFEYFLVEDRGTTGATRAEQTRLRDAYEAMRSLNRDCGAVAAHWSAAITARRPRVA
jgi:hypothetical protein